ncbi:MAG: phosphoenolpyruvate carboxykinase (GTP), partial [Candidatus Aenigmarchaeota archaeon]|nr:phosphoenolpyruvate carboxykinase (GTP) [Candidatus Aenigmarchaeota archaeon]
GLLPKQGDLDLKGINIPSEDVKELMKVDPEEWKAEIPDIEHHFALFGNRLPETLRSQLKEFVSRLDRASSSL